MMTLRHKTAAEVRNQQREREREIKRERERGKEPQPKERKGDRHISSKIGFDTATSSFLNLFINKSHRKKTEKAKLKALNSAIKKSKPFFVSKVLSSNPSPRLEKFRWPVMVVELTKEQKI